MNDKKPSMSVVNTGWLRSRINYYLRVIERQSDDKRQQEMGYKLLDYSREYRERRKMAGFYGWPSVVFAGLCVIVLAFAIVSRSKQIYSYHDANHYLRVLQNVEPCLPDGTCGYSWVMQAVHDGVADDPVEMHFCRDFQPRWEAGHTLTPITITNHGSCWSVDSFDVLREDQSTFVNGQWQRLPVLAPNCGFDWSTPNGHISCEGGRANFDSIPNERRNSGTKKEESERQEEAKSIRR